MVKREVEPAPLGDKEPLHQRSHESQGENCRDCYVLVSLPPWQRDTAMFTFPFVVKDSIANSPFKPRSARPSGPQLQLGHGNSHGREEQRADPEAVDIKPRLAEYPHAQQFVDQHGSHSGDR